MPRSSVTVGQDEPVRVLLVVNPAARRVTDAAVRLCTERWSARHELTVLHSSGPSTASALAPLLCTRATSDGTHRTDGPGTADGGPDAVVVLGGDGILNTVANAMLDAGSAAALVPLPAGTTNVVARSIGLPPALADAEPIAREAFERGRVARRGVGRINGRAFLANAGIGFDASVVARTEAAPSRKRRFGHAWFAASATAEVLSRHGARHAALRCDEGLLDGTLFWVLALAAHPYTYVGPRPIEPVGPAGWSGDGGSLRLVGVAPMGVNRLLRLASTAIFTSRGIDRAKGVYFARTSSAVTISSRDAVNWQIDGEPQPAQDRFTLRWEPAAIRVLDLAATPAAERSAARPPTGS